MYYTKRIFENNRYSTAHVICMSKYIKFFHITVHLEVYFKVWVSQQNPENHDNSGDQGKFHCTVNSGTEFLYSK